MWEDELKKKWYLHNAKMNDTDKILFGNDYMCFTSCENEVIEFIESLLKQAKKEEFEWLTINVIKNIDSWEGKIDQELINKHKVELEK